VHETGRCKARCTLSLVQELLSAHREVVEVREPERGGDDEAEQRGRDHPHVEVGAASAAPDRDQRFADGDDHDHPCRSTKCAGASRQPRTSAKKGPRKPITSAATQITGLPSPCTNPAARISDAPRMLAGTMRKTAVSSSGSERAESA